MKLSVRRKVVPSVWYVNDLVSDQPTLRFEGQFHAQLLCVAADKGNMALLQVVTQPEVDLHPGVIQNELCITRGNTMAKIVHARLDDESEALLRRLGQASGLSDSEVLRRGLMALEAVSGRAGRPRIIGLAGFSSGQPDLGSNKAHLSGFGKK